VRHPVSPVGTVDELFEVPPGRAARAPQLEAAVAAERERRREAEDLRLAAQLRRGVAALLDKKADKLLVLNLQGLTTMSDFFVLATASSDRQAQALADAVVTALKTAGRRPLSLEGYPAAPWILVDYGDVVFHIFQEEARRFYGLERLWGDAPDATASFR